MHDHGEPAMAKGPRQAAARGTRLSAEALMRVAKAVADPQRLDLLRRVAQGGELCCMELLQKCELTQATVSHHLKELTTAGLLVRRKEGKFAFYAFQASVLEAYTRQLTEALGVAASEPAR
jgi:ArsR family transcriptional regulator